MPEDADHTRLAPDPFLRLKAGDARCSRPVFVLPGQTVAEAARAMAQAGATAALVRGAGKTQAEGIITERDVLTRVVAAGLDAATLPVSRVMTTGVLTASQGELLIESFSRMVRHAVRRLVLVDDAGLPVGVLGEGDLLAARGESPLALAREIAAAGDVPALAQAFRSLERLAARSIAEGIGSEPVGRLISEMHDRIMSRAWGLAADATTAELGPAPGQHAVFVLGSQARREQYLATDQDMAMAWDGDADDWCAAMGERLCAAVLEVGFPACPKRIMLDNPDWRRGRDAWLDLADAIAERPEAQGVVTASLLADMRPLPAPPGVNFGADLGAELPRALCARLGASPVLLRFLAREAVRFRAPLGLFGGLALTRDEEGRGVLDIKRGGVFPVTQGARVLALEHGLRESGTLPRLRALGREGALSPTLAGGLCEAAEMLQSLRMRAQAQSLAEGRTPDNLLRPEGLGPMARGRLREAFKLVAELQDLLFEKYGLRLLG